MLMCHMIHDTKCNSVFIQVVQFAVDNHALLVTNDNFKNFSFESEAFKEQVENRVVGYTWDGDEFALSYERKQGSLLLVISV